MIYLVSNVFDLFLTIPTLYINQFFISLVTVSRKGYIFMYKGRERYLCIKEGRDIKMLYNSVA